MTSSPSALEGFPADIRAFVAAVVESNSFQRLKNISFLGAIDRFARQSTNGSSRSSGSRFEHSLGVAEIVFSIAGKVDLTPGELRIAVANALLHDVGHGPFSHSSEPYFSRVFDINHHKVLLSIVDDPVSEVSKILKSFGLWRDYRRFVRCSSSIPAVDQLFFGPINVDTIEGIVRSATFFEIDTSLDCNQLADSISQNSIRVRSLDRFWGLKSAVYNQYIFSSQYASYDHALTRSLCAITHKIRPEHFRLDDASLERELGDEFMRQVEIQRAEVSVHPAPKFRNFQINRGAQVRKFDALDARYAEVRSGQVRQQGDDWLWTRGLSKRVENLQLKESQN